MKTWTSVGGAIGVVPFLEATLLETHLSPGHFWFFSHGRLRPVVVTSPLDKLNGCCRAYVVVFAAMVAVGSCRMIVDCGCLLWTAAAGVAWQPSVRRGTASKDGTGGLGIMGQLGLQRIAAGCSAWLGFPVRYIVGRRRKRLLRLPGMVTEVMCAGEASR